MALDTVMTTVNDGLCCGCGVCLGCCPRGALSWKMENGLYSPVVEESLCIHCGLCASVCPGSGHPYTPADTALDTVSGPVLNCYNAWSKDPELRHSGASGGVVSTLILSLLRSGIYDGAFALDSYDCHTQLKTRLFSAAEVSHWAQAAPKSRYLPVSHESAVAYIRKYRDARLILIGTSCAIRGLQSYLSKMNLDRNQYLFIGLFCDKVFNYSFLSYLEDSFTSGVPLQALHFKNKESGGWPGNMKLFPSGEDPFFVSSSVRAESKAYFMPERCLYCIDKLNVCADISLGDNYTGKDESPLGSNSVIIRTPVGACAWDAVSSGLIVHTVALQDIHKAQYMEGRLNSLYFGDLKTASAPNIPDLNPGVPREADHSAFRAAWKEALTRLHAGGRYGTNPAVLQKQLARDRRKPNALVNFLGRVAQYLKRKIK